MTPKPTENILTCITRYSPARIYREFHPSTRDDKNKQSIITPQTKADTTKGRPEIRDVYIAVMGGPGAGKSALISMCAGKDVKPLHDPKSGMCIYTTIVSTIYFF